MNDNHLFNLFFLALDLAWDAHQHATDKGGNPYILHSLRVMRTVCGGVHTTLKQRILGLLHDLLEDTDWTVEDLAERGFPADILNSLEALTRKPGENYMDFIERVGRDEDAILVKLADLRDNMDLSRIPCPTQEDRNRVKKYLKAETRLCEILTSKKEEKF
jgi:(p)ppGpp synthase/HD superfamily hydrolase